MESARLVPHDIQYIEFLSEDFTRIKAFYEQAFGWTFTDYGEEYTAFSGQWVDGGFAKGKPAPGSVRVILYSSQLERSKTKVEAAGGVITKDIFEFPGGQRFEFADPDGNRLAVWSDV